MVFALLFILAVFGQAAVEVNYNVTDYLPPDTPSTKALEVLSGEFAGGIQNARLMERDVSLAEALSLKGALAAVPGVEGVTWLDDAVDILQPLELQDQDTVETYY